jgi:pyridoxine/pyridoxamine 5'-phosphate oxidase
MTLATSTTNGKPSGRIVLLKGIKEKKDASGLKEQADYIKSKLPADKPLQ